MYRMLCYIDHIIKRSLVHIKAVRLIGQITDAADIKKFAEEWLPAVDLDDRKRVGSGSTLTEYVVPDSYFLRYDG